MSAAAETEVKGAIVQSGGGGKARAMMNSFMAECRAVEADIELAAKVYAIKPESLVHLKNAFFFAGIGNNLVPDHFQGDVRSLYTMSTVAESMAMPLVEVLQGVYFIGGRYAWYTEFMIKRVLSLGVFKKLVYKTGGKIEDGTAWAQAVGTYPDGTEAVGTAVSLKMAKDEGWIDKKGSKWKTMPAYMLKKRAATWLIRECAPHIFGAFSMTEDEAQDISGGDGTPGNPYTFENKGPPADASVVMGEILGELADEQRASQDEVNRQAMLGKVEDRISARMRAGQEPSDIEQLVGMPIDAINDLSTEKLLAVWEKLK